MLLVESQAGVVRLTLNRPERRNALSEAMLTELGKALERIAANREARVVVLAAAGPVFCSGHDLGEMTGRSEAEYQTLFARCSRVMQMIRQLPQPVIARVQGLATAAGQYGDRKDANGGSVGRSAAWKRQECAQGRLRRVSNGA